MRSYVEILTELKNTVSTDTMMPNRNQIKVMKMVDALFNLLWRYSD